MSGFPQADKRKAEKEKKKEKQTKEKHCIPHSDGMKYCVSDLVVFVVRSVKRVVNETKSGGRGEGLLDFQGEPGRDFIF